MRERPSINETCLLQGELYTIVTNKLGRGEKETLVAMIKGVRSDSVIRILKLLPHSKRKKVK